MKALKIIGWLCIPYIMVIFQWKKIGKFGRTVGSIWAAFALLIVFAPHSNQSKDQSIAAVPQQSSKLTASTTPTSTPVAVPAVSPTSTPTAVPTVSPTATPTATPTTTPTITATTNAIAASNTNGEFTPENPVSVSYLKDYLKYMDDYYTQLHDTVYNPGATINELQWGKLLASHNQEGWDRYKKIGYVTNFNVESSDIFTKRTDTAEAWVMLQDLSMTYDSYLHHSGKGLKDIEKDEKEYKDSYEKAMNEL